MEPNYQKRAAFSIVLAVLVTIFVCIWMAAPGFGDAVWQTLYCSFANVTCVQIVP